MFKPHSKVYAYIMIFLLLWIVVSSFEYGDFRFAKVLHPLLWILIGLTGVWLLRNNGYKPIRIKLIILFGIYLLATCWFLFSGVFCKSGDGRVVYVNKKNRANTIICRSYSCFLTDDDCEYYSRWKIAGDLRWSRKVYKTKFDSTEWERFK